MRNTNRLHACCVGCGFCGRAKSRFCIPELRACSALGVVDMTGARPRAEFKWMAPGFPRVGRAAPLSYLCVYNVVYLPLCCCQERRSASRQQSSEIRSRASTSPRPAKLATSFPRGGCDVSTRRLRRQVSGALRAPLPIPLRAPPRAWSRGTCGTRNFRSSLRSLRARSGP